jgi:hypothetical protein
MEKKILCPINEGLDVRGRERTKRREMLDHSPPAEKRFES